MTAFLFTFQDQDTGQLLDALAPNEAAARLQLGEHGIDIERTQLFAQPSEFGGIHQIIEEAIKEERRLHNAANAANPIGKGLATTSDFKTFRDAEEAHRKAQERVRALIKISLST